MLVRMNTEWPLILAIQIKDWIQGGKMSLRTEWGENEHQVNIDTTSHSNRNWMQGLDKIECKDWISVPKN